MAEYLHFKQYMRENCPLKTGYDSLPLTLLGPLASWPADFHGRRGQKRPTKPITKIFIHCNIHFSAVAESGSNSWGFSLDILVIHGCRR